MAKIDIFLKLMHESGASDLHLGADLIPRLRTDGSLEKTKHRRLSAEEVRLLIYEVLSEVQIRELESNGELDFAYTIEDVARFRVNVFQKFPGLGAAFRIIPHEIPTIKGLGLPDAFEKMLSTKNGLVLVTGPTNSGKSTTLAAMVNHLNENTHGHILTLEDPLEFIHESKNSIVNQRQIGEHSKSFANALRASLREDPNVILVGEMRDIETISLALSAAETGVLVLGALHTKSAPQTISHIIDVFPVHQQPQIRLSLSEVLVGICSQQLLKRRDGDGRVAAFETLVANAKISDLIRNGKHHEVHDVMVTARKEGMQLLDQYLVDLVKERSVSVEEAMQYATDPQTIIKSGNGSTANPTDGE